MNGFILDIIFSAMLYAILIYFLRWKYSFRRTKRKNKGNNDGGITAELPWIPDLDLPPGVVPPQDSPEIERKETEDPVLV